MVGRLGAREEALYPLIHSWKVRRSPTAKSRFPFFFPNPRISRPRLGLSYPARVNHFSHKLPPTFLPLPPFFGLVDR